MDRVTIQNPDHLDFYKSESYKTIRTNLMFSGEHVKAIVVTSCMSGEGKTTVSFNLAMDMARSGKRVVYVDADLRRSLMASRYKINGFKDGLTHFLSGQCPVNSAIYATDVENFYIVPAGPTPPNPSELLNGTSFKQFIAALKRSFDFIIIDAPPLGTVIDSVIIADECDGSVVVVKADSIDRKFAAKVMSQLKKSSTPILGAILTMVPMKKRGYYSRYYYNKY